MRATFYITALVASILALGCVSRVDYDVAVADAQRARSELAAARDKANQDLRVKQESIDRCNKELQESARTLEDRDQMLSKGAIDAHNLQAQLDDATAIDERLRQELQRLGKNVDQLLADKGTLSHVLDETKTRLEELRKAQVAAEARTVLYRQLLAKFKGLTDAGQLRIAVRDGRLVLQLPGDVLFDSGQVMIRSDGRRTLEQIAAVLKTMAGRRFQVAGHTDNVPVDSGRFASNWELSTARALSVVHLLTARGVAPEMLSAAGYGEFRPVEANDTPEHQAMNRRIEISLLPNMEELAHLADVS